MSNDFLSDSEWNWLILRFWFSLGEWMSPTQTFFFVGFWFCAVCRGDFFYIFKKMFSINRLRKNVLLCISTHFKNVGSNIGPLLDPMFQQSLAHNIQDYLDNLGLSTRLSLSNNLSLSTRPSLSNSSSLSIESCLKV